ncbi:MAG: hypothetical protein IKX25_04410 [Bacteroidales bacterium]|nr:hypothetical protein [Bacteroidales bacterium]
MKKIYYTPLFSVNRFESIEIISTSGNPKITNTPADDGVQYGKHRNGIWDEDE